MLNSTVTTNVVSAAFHSAAMPAFAAFTSFNWHTTHNARANAAAYSHKATATNHKYGQSGTWGNIG